MTPGSDIDTRTTSRSRLPFRSLLALTLVRIPLAIVFLAMLPVAGQWRFPSTFLAGGILLGCIELSDLFDGMLARKYGLVSESGKMLDPYADSISRLIVYWALSQHGYLLAFVPMVMAVRDVTVAYCRIHLASRKQPVSARRGGKIKAATQAVAGLLAFVGPLYWHFAGRWPIAALSWLVACVTVYSAYDYLAAAFRAPATGNGEKQA